MNDFYSFSIVVSYFTSSDWERIILEGDDNDNLKRAESRNDMWEKWLHTFSTYDNRKEFVFKLLNKENIKGFIYIVKNGETNLYKIGWTKNKEINRNRIKTLQTSSPFDLKLIGLFQASNIKTEKKIHDHFSSKRVSGEWLELTDKDIENILSDNWRILKNLF